MQASNPQILPEHLRYWESRGVSRDIIDLNVQSISNPPAIAQKLNYKRWTQGAGWIVSGVDPETGQPTQKGLQFRPDSPPLVTDKKTGEPKLNSEGVPKVRKFLNPKDVEAAPLFLRMPEGNYWQQVLQNDVEPIFLLEGAAKAGTLLTHGKVAISLPGVTTGQKLDRLKDALLPFCTTARPIYLTFDADWKTNSNVRKSLRSLGALLRIRDCVVFVMDWDLDKGKGADDFIVANGFAAFQQVIDAAPTFKEWAECTKQEESKQVSPIKNLSGKSPLVAANGKGVKLLATSAIAKVLTEEYGGTLQWNTEVSSFFAYEADPLLQGVWVKEREEFIHRMIQTELDSRGAADLYSAGYISSIYRLMQNYLAVRHWDEAPGLLPMQNGVLAPSSNNLLPHMPRYGFTWQLPYSYNSSATCDPVIEWLTESQDGDHQRVQLLRAYLKAIVTGRPDFQRFLELVGPGGTGKSTYICLATALVGLRNTFSTELKYLENNRFETAAIRGKRLIVVTDADRYAGSVNVLKAITGQDLLREEQKGKQQKSSFAANALVIIAANEAIASTDYTSGLERRRLTVPFTNQVAPTKRRDLLTVDHAGMRGEFAPFLPGVLNWVLALPDSDMRDLLLDTQIYVPSLADWKAESILQSNPLADWLNANIIYDPAAKTYVGMANEIQRTETSGEPGNTSSTSWKEWKKSKEWLYANYVTYCDTVGHKCVAVQRFSRLLEDLCSAQLKLKVRRGRDQNGSYFEGLAIRNEDHESILGLVRAAFTPSSLLSSDGANDGF